MKFDSRVIPVSGNQILFAVFAWSLLILRFGYRYGTGDQVELLPYTLFLQNSALYPHDFFLRGLNAAVPNERTIMASLLIPFANHLEIFCLLLQFSSTVILVLGLLKLARRFIQNRYVAFIAVLVALIPFNDYALGNVEVYSECFQASALATAIVVWAIHYFLNRKYLIASSLISIATFFQLLEGLDVMMVMSGVLLIAFWRKEVSLKSFLSFISLYAFTAGIYLIMIFVEKTKASDISNQELFKILFEFRHPHHFIFSSFPKHKVILFLGLSICSVIYFNRHSKTIFHFILIGLVGVFIYAFAVDGLQNIFIGNFQFYKITQWIKFLGVLSVFAFVEQILLPFIPSLNSSLERAMLVLSSVLCWIVIINFSNLLPYKVPFQLFKLKEQDEMIAICGKIKYATPNNAVFIQPFENTELKFYAQRSSYVEFKANVRNKVFVKEWAKRLEQVFGVTPDMDVKGFELQKAADLFFYTIDAAHLNLLKKEGVTHVLTKKGYPLSLGNLILQNNTYAVYQL